MFDKVLLAQHDAREIVQVGERALIGHPALSAPFAQGHIEIAHAGVVKEHILRRRRPIVSAEAVTTCLIQLDVVPIEDRGLDLHVILPQGLILNNGLVLDNRLAAFHLELIHLAAFAHHHLVVPRLGGNRNGWQDHGTHQRHHVQVPVKCLFHCYIVLMMFSGRSVKNLTPRSYSKTIKQSQHPTSFNKS